VTADEVQIRRALDHLPAVCRYHGTDIEASSPHLNRAYNGACCATGEPALARRRALAVLDAAGRSEPMEVPRV